MSLADLLNIITLGENSRHKFKRDVTNADDLSAELAAFASRFQKYHLTDLGRHWVEYQGMQT